MIDRDQVSSAKGGFSLVEISFALLVVALGLLAVFHLFPAGLRASVDATADTRTSEFAAEFYGALRAQAKVETNYAAWASAFDTLSVADWDPTPQPFNLYSLSQNDSWSDAFQYPYHTEGDWQREYLRFRPRIDFNGVGSNAVSVTLEVKYGKAGGIVATYHSGFYFYGM